MTNLGNLIRYRFESDPKANSRFFAILLKIATFYNCQYDWWLYHDNGVLNKSANNEKINGQKSATTYVELNGDNLYPDSKRLRYFFLIRLSLQLFGIFYAIVLLSLYHYMQYNNIESIHDLHTIEHYGDYFNQTSSPDHDNSRWAWCKKTKVHAAAYLFALLDPLVTLDTIKIGLYHLELLILLATCIQNSLSRIERNRIFKRLSETFEMLESGYDDFIDDYLNAILVSSPKNIGRSIRKQRAQMRLLNTLIKRSYCKILSPNIPMRRFYPMIVVDRSVGQIITYSSCSATHQDHHTECFHCGEKVFDKSREMNRQYKGYDFRKISPIARLFLLIGSIEFVMANLVGMYIYIEFSERNDCVLSLNLLERTLLMAVKSIVLNIFYLNSGLCVFINGFMYIFAVMTVLAKIKLLHKIMKNYSDGIRAAINNRGLKLGHKKYYYDSANVKSIVTNLLRINNYILWKTETFDVFFRTGTICFFLWMITSVICASTCMIKYYSVMNIYENITSLLFVTLYFSAIATLNTAASLNKKVGLVRTNQRLQSD